MSVSFFNISDTVESNGKTIRQNNMELKHAIPVGALVETYKRERLYVAWHTRDCDGTPLYSLCMHDDLGRNFDVLEERMYSSHVGGYCDDSLTVIDSNPSPVEDE